MRTSVTTEADKALFKLFSAHFGLKGTPAGGTESGDYGITQGRSKGPTYRQGCMAFVGHGTVVSCGLAHEGGAWLTREVWSLGGGGRRMKEDRQLIYGGGMMEGSDDGLVSKRTGGGREGEWLPGIYW